MLLLEIIPYKMSAYFEAVLDTALLAILSSPAIYFWVVRPFVSARDRALMQVGHMAATDPLTGLANRRLILKHLDSLIATSARHKDHGAVLLIDVDEFKPVNDSRGHAAGDAVLIRIADRLRSAVRAGDTVGRLGGDEFVVLLSRLDAETAMRDADHAMYQAKQRGKGCVVFPES